ncbi:MAG: SMI1/KNR4 family protein [Armatimonadetes bacterium]|nr:SMI1/KNR4 family protein [Armatimonadota bacterium]
MTIDEIQSLKDLLHQMQTEDPHYRVFGSGRHQYLLNPTQPEAVLQSFEKRHGISLPEGYRRFLTQVGDGGAGPWYGLFSLEQTLEGNNLRRPFPEVNTNVHRFRGKRPGILTLCEYGCGIYFYLVVRGEAYGTIWQVEDSYFERVAPSFESWYGQWVEMLRLKAQPILANERRIASIQVGMSLDEVIRLYGKSEKWHVQFEGLTTQFTLDEDERILRIIDHCIW